MSSMNHEAAAVPAAGLAGESVTESAKVLKGDAIDRCIPSRQVSLEAILCTDELLRRPSRPPDYGKENRALVALSAAAAARLAISDPAATYSTATLRCYSGMSSAVTPISNPSPLRLKRLYWFLFTWQAKLSARSGLLPTMIA